MLDQTQYIDLLGPVILAEALALDHDPVAHAPGHLVVGDQQVPAALREDGTGGPVSGGENFSVKIFQNERLPRDATTVKVVV